MRRGFRHLSGSQPSGHFRWAYNKEVMPGGMAYVDAVGRYDSVVALDKVTDIGGNQRIRSPGDRSVDDATVLQIEAWGKSRQIVRIVDRHSGVSSRDRPAAQHDVRKVAGWPEARNGFDERYEPSSQSRGSRLFWSGPPTTSTAWRGRRPTELAQRRSAHPGRPRQYTAIPCLVNFSRWPGNCSPTRSDRRKA